MLADYAQLVDNDDPNRGATKTINFELLDKDKILSTWKGMLYRLGIWFCFLEGVGLTGYYLFFLFTEGVQNDSNVEGDASGESTFLDLYLTVSNIFVFWYGIVSMKQMDVTHQERFVAFLKVFSELVFLLMIFLLIGLFAYKNSDSSLKIETYIGATVFQIAMYISIYFKASHILNHLVLIEKGTGGSNNA